MEYALTLVMLALGWVGIAKDEWIKTQRKRRIVGWVIALLLLGVAGIECKITRDRIHAEKYGSETGRLESARKVREGEKPTLGLCESFLAFSGPAGEPLFRVGVDQSIADALIVRIEDGALRFSVVIRDAKGLIVAAIADNAWFVPHNPSAVLDRNFDDEALEVLDAKGRPILQVLLDGNIARFAGKSHTGTGAPRGFDPLLTACGADAKGGTLFRYPSEQYPGVRRVSIARPEPT